MQYTVICWYLVKTTLAVYLIFDKIIFFESLIIFLEPVNKLFTGILIFKSNNNSYHDDTSVFFNDFDEEDPHLDAVKCQT